MTAPERSFQQRREALDVANGVRSKRARLKRSLRAGQAAIYPYLLEPPEWLKTAKVADMLIAIPKYGAVKVSKALTQCRISPSKTFGGLTERQRNDLAALLQHRR
ncbi:MAG: hypothetical protein H0U33_03830 [Solirubrobacterales bacterium]|jgi:hypothetical protein|nr:hypothetical protein [Solirubrobacterales bacterium]